MKSKDLFYINIALFVGLILLVVVLFKTYAPAPSETIKDIQPVKPPVIQPAAKSEPVSYDINKVKGSQHAGPTKEPTSLKEMYEGASQEDAGENIIEKWKMLKSEDKARFKDSLAEKIEKYKNILKSNPGDQAAKESLYIVETLKKLADNDFNVDFKEASAKEKK